jgi:tRNA(fMet)-specific endonuclease VapC
MILLDTDHVSVLKYREHPRCVGLRSRMEAAGWTEFAVPVVSVEEQVRGWLAKINSLRNVRDQIPAYIEFAALFDFFKDWPIVPFDDRAAVQFEWLRRQKVRIGTMDLKIAAVALANGALLLSANRRDYGKVPGLRVENWLA